jgi:hypothetical protein
MNPECPFIEQLARFGVGVSFPNFIFDDVDSARTLFIEGKQLHTFRQLEVWPVTSTLLLCTLSSRGSTTLTTFTLTLGLHLDLLNGFDHIFWFPNENHSL